MSNPVQLTGNIYDISRTPQDDAVTVSPLIPTGVPNVTGVGVLDDGVMVDEAVTVAANSRGEYSILLIPTSQTAAGADGRGVWYRISFSPTEFVEFAMPDGAQITLAEILSQDASVSTLSPTARQVVYDQAKNILQAGDNISIGVDDSARELTLISTGGGGGGGGSTEQRVLVDVDTASVATVDKIVLNDEEAELTEYTIIHEGTPQQVTFADLVNANLIGFLASDPNPAIYNVGQWYFNTISHRPRVVTDLDPITQGEQKGFIDAVLTELIPGNEQYAGEFATDAAAAPQIANLGDVYYNTTDRTLRVATRLTSGSAPVEGYRYKRIATEKDLALLNSEISRAADATQTNQRLGHLENITSDIDLLSNNPGWSPSTASFGCLLYTSPSPRDS